MKTTTEMIAKEGWKPIGVGLLLLLLSGLFGWKIFAFLCLLVTLCLMYFYRNTERIMEDNASDSLLSPLDGVIKNIENKSDGIYLQISKPICFCGMLRMPLANLGKCGEALEIEHIKGLKNGDEITGERITLAFHRETDKTPTSTLYLTLYPKYFAQTSLYLWDSNFRLGERIGFFLNGNATLKIPLNSELRVNIHDKILGGKTLLGKVQSTQSERDLKKIQDAYDSKDEQQQD
ncbi:MULTISPECIES: hypothetical protein [Helicobacter]|uniref:hypothetical protein n=1 Tax=Helicobacter TaxID=209 RepID=UPI0015F196FE|nr:MULTISPECIES: hypothetical protein [Helicobacter]